MFFILFALTAVYCFMNNAAFFSFFFLFFKLLHVQRDRLSYIMLRDVKGTLLKKDVYNNAAWLD